MQVKATTIQRYKGTSGDPYVDGRLEIQWALDSVWFNLGIRAYQELEWDLIVLLMALGAKEAKVTFIHECLV